MAGISTRLATMDDYDAICRLFKQLDDHHVALLPGMFQPYSCPARPRDLVEANQKGPDAAQILAEIDGVPVGLLAIRKTALPNYPMFKPREFVMVENMVTDERHRRQGVGEALMEAAKRWARERGLKHLQVKVWTANASAIAFYEKSGFRPLVQTMELGLMDEKEGH